MKQMERRPAGRPRGFDREKALDTAMRLFWRYGYEGVSLQQLTAALGISAPSVYAAFGNKTALYLEALDRYGDLRGANDLSYMEATSSLREAVHLLLDGIARGLVDPEGERGCMLNGGMITGHPDHADLVSELSKRRKRFRESIAERLTVWVPKSEAVRIAGFVFTVIQGLAMQARDGYDLEALQTVVSEALKGLPDART